MEIFNRFQPNDSDRLWAYLDEAQKQLAIYDPFVSKLPDSKEVKAIGVMLIEALRTRNKAAEISCLYFDVPDPKNPTNGVFRSVMPVWLTEDLKEYGLYQTLSQDLADLVLEMVG